MKDQQRQFYLLTFGCPKNEVVSENIARNLYTLGLIQTLEVKQADFVIINTCGFIQSALEENLKTIKSLVETRLIASLRNKPQLIVFGCIPQRFSRDLLISQYPFLNKIALWSPDWKTLKQYLQQNYRLEVINSNPIPNRFNTYSPMAYVEIAQGCSQNCAFCTIPSFKGPYRSKKPELILQEIKELLQYGVKEIILIAQETTFYGLEFQTNLSQLISRILKEFPNLPRLRIMYAHPNGITNELIETIKNNPRVCPYLDIPLQHIDNRILERMNRHYTEEKIKKLIEKLRKEISNIHLRSTFIVGYPGETEKQFEKLKTFLQEYELDYAGFFAYERENGTPAANLPHQIPENVKQKRLQEIYALQQKISAQKMKKIIGQRIEILTEFQDKKFTYGRTVFQAPEIDGFVKVTGNFDTGKFIKVKIVRIEYPHLIGKTPNS